MIDPDLWTRVEERRHQHARRHPGPVTYRLYPLGGLLVCRSCGRRLTGHGGRYRHTEACPQFRAARPSGPDGRVRGESYTGRTFEMPVREAIGRLSANRVLVSEVQAAVASEAVGAGPDQLALTRIARARREAVERAVQDRDYARLESEMKRLDGDEAAAKVADPLAVNAREVEEYLADLPALYDAAEPLTQKRILQALFERIEVLGPNQLWLVASAEAEMRGLAPAFTGEFRTKVSQTGRGERVRARGNQQIRGCRVEFTGVDPAPLPSLRTA